MDSVRVSLGQSWHWPKILDLSVGICGIGRSSTPVTKSTTVGTTVPVERSNIFYTYKYLILVLQYSVLSSSALYCSTCVIALDNNVIWSIE